MKNISLIKNTLKMSEYFELYEKAITKYNKENINTVDTDTSNCSHTETIDEGGTITCTECGEELKRNVMHEKEWRYYGSTDTKRSGDPNRVQARKSDDKSIFKDVETMRFSSKVVSDANDLYTLVTKGHIYRGKTRKAIIFACIFQAYKTNNNPQPYDQLINMFSITKKAGLGGIKHVGLNAPKDSKMHTMYITPVNLMEDIMMKFNATEAQKDEVKMLYESIKNRSSILNRSRPQSVAAGVIYYWIDKNGININLKDFAQKADLSELTITKISKEIQIVLG